MNYGSNIHTLYKSHFSGSSCRDKFWYLDGTQPKQLFTRYLLGPAATTRAVPKHLDGSLVIAATVITIISAFLQRKNKTVFITLLIASAFFASCIFISRFGNLPIQTEMLNWKTNSLPDNWTSLRDKWWSFHIVRTITELIALALVSWTSSKTAINTSQEK